jgi:hypothetical protein
VIRQGCPAPGRFQRRVSLWCALFFQLFVKTLPNNSYEMGRFNMVCFSAFLRLFAIGILNLKTISNASSDFLALE